MKWELTPQWEQVKALLAQGEPGDSYALILNSQLPQDVPFEVVKKYPGSTFIVRILATVGREAVKASSDAKLTYRAPKRVYDTSSSPIPR